MADTRISELSALSGADVASTDEFVVVDKSDTTMAASGTDKRVVASGLPSIPALANAFDAAGAATSAVTTHAGATDPHGDRAYAAALVDDLSGVTDAATARANIGAAPLTPSFLMLGTNSELTNERVLTAGTNITLTDGGAGSTLTIAATGGGSVPAYQFGPSLSGTRYARNPGMAAASLGTYAVMAGQTYYWPIEVLSAIQFDAFQLEVTAGAAGTVRMGLYPAGTDWMPSATLIQGSAAIDTSTTGVKTDSFTAVSLPAGRYCLAYNASNFITCRRIVFASNIWAGGNALVSWFHVYTGSHGAMPSTPVAPTTIASDTTTYCWGFMRCTP